MSFRTRQVHDQSPGGGAARTALAQEKGHPEIDGLHLLAALLQEAEGIVVPMLQKIGVNRTQLDKHDPVRTGAVSARLRPGVAPTSAGIWPRCCRPPSAKPTR